MGIAARRRGWHKASTQDRLRGRVNKKDADLRGDDFERLRPLVLDRDNYTCRRCPKHNRPDSPTNVVLTVHHIVPIAMGGKNLMSNLITLCKDCHANQLGAVNKKGKALLKSLKGKSFESKGGWGDTWRSHDK